MGRGGSEVEPLRGNERRTVKRFGKEMELYEVETESGLRHLTPKLYIQGMVGDVPRTMCQSMITKCSPPRPLQGSIYGGGICSHCFNNVKETLLDPDYRAVLLSR